MLSTLVVIRCDLIAARALTTIDPEMAVSDGFSLPSAMADLFNVPPQASLSAACFSKVFKVHDKLTGEGYAVKVLSRDDFFAKRSGDLIENEFLALKRCFEETWKHAPFF